MAMASAFSSPRLSKPRYPLDQLGDLLPPDPDGAGHEPELLAPAVLARAHRAVPALGRRARTGLAERQAILIEGVTRFVTRDGRCNGVTQAWCPARSFEVVGPVTRLVQALRVDILELRRPVLGEQIELPLIGHDHQDLALADDARVLPPLRIHANLVVDRLHRDRDLVRDLQSVRQHREGGRGVP